MTEEEPKFGQAGHCSICTKGGKHQAFEHQINTSLAMGKSAVKIAGEMRDYGHVIKRTTIGAHLHNCLGGDRTAGVNMNALKRATRSDAAPEGRDFARAVQRQALELLEAGAIRVTTRDGLAAQGLIDRREEKQKDREFALNLARLLSGGGEMAPQGLIEGEYVDVTPDQHLDQGLLAPAELRDP